MTEHSQSSASSALNSDTVWSLIESRVTERLRFLKIAIVVIAAIVSFFVSILVWILSDRDIREHLIDKYVFNFAEQLSKPAATNALDAYMRHTLAYTYSARLTLGAGRGHKSEDAIPFYKTGNDRGRLICTAIYPNNSVRNAITAQWNELGSKVEFAFEHPTAPIAKLDAVIPTDPKSLFGPQSFNTANQKVKFRIADYPSFGADVVIDCTMLIVGPARFMDKLD
jgi:hypothetical protein